MSGPFGDEGNVYVIARKTAQPPALEPVTYPRPLRSIHQIELSTFCNLRCSYCPSPKQPELRQQPPMHMARRVFERALDWAVALNDRRDENRAELSLTGIGEALLHPAFVEFLALARQRLPVHPLVFSTNGLLLTDDLAAAIAPFKPRVWVSLHRPEKAGPAIEVAKRHGIYAGPNPAPATAAFDWAGQVPWFVSAPPLACQYLRDGWGVVLVDGRITTCCLDASAKGVVGHVDDPIESLTVAGRGLKPYELCGTCHCTVP